MHRPLIFVVTAILVMIVSAGVGEALWLSDTPPSIGTEFPIPVEPLTSSCPPLPITQRADEYLVVWQDTPAAASTTMSMLSVLQRSGELLASVAVINAAADAAVIAFRGVECH